MRRIAVACGVLLLTLFGSVIPANADTCPPGTTIGVGLVCVSSTNGVEIQDPSGNVVADVPIPAPVTITVPTLVPGPTKTVTVAPRTVTQTVTASPRTVTVPASPTTVTETTTETQTITTGQARPTPAIVSRTPASLATPPAEPGSNINIVPKRPGAALAEGTLIGIILGALAALFIAYLRGKRVGEQETLQESLDIVRGEGPKIGRHRVE